jgi:hypothetical protein
VMGRSLGSESLRCSPACDQCVPQYWSRHTTASLRSRPASTRTCRCACSCGIHSFDGLGAEDACTGADARRRTRLRRASRPCARIVQGVGGR